MKCNLWKLHNFTFCQKLYRQSCCLLWVFWLYQASSTCPLSRVFPQIRFYFLSGYSLLSFLWLICGGEDNQKLAAYHVVSERLEFADLFSKASQSRLPTRLTNYSILVTNYSESGFDVDDVLITEAAVFVDTFIAIDFIASPLDFEMYGHVESKPSGSDSTLKSEWSFFSFMLITVVARIISEIFILSG